MNKIIMTLICMSFIVVGCKKTTSVSHDWYSTERITCSSCPMENILVIRIKIKNLTNKAIDSVRIEPIEIENTILISSHVTGNYKLLPNCIDTISFTYKSNDNIKFDNFFKINKKTRLFRNHDIVYNDFSREVVIHENKCLIKR